MREKGADRSLRGIHISPPNEHVSCYFSCQWDAQSDRNIITCKTGLLDFSTAIYASLFKTWWFCMKPVWIKVHALQVWRKNKRITSPFDQMAQSERNIITCKMDRFLDCWVLFYFSTFRVLDAVNNQPAVSIPDWCHANNNRSSFVCNVTPPSKRLTVYTYTKHANAKDIHT